MSESRFTGLALGRYGNFYATTNNVFTQADTTPDVTDGVFFFSNNTTSTVITDFDLTTPGPIPGGSAKGSIAANFEGKVLEVMFLDDSTSLARSARMVLASSNGLQGENSYIRLIYHNSSWIETNRSYNQSDVINVDSNGLKTVTGNPFMNASTGNINVRGRGPNVTINMIHDSTGNWTMRRAVGGAQGTLLTLVAAGDSHSLVIVNSAAADTFVCMSSGSSTQFRLIGSAAVTFVRYLNKWHEVTPVISGTGGVSTAI